MIIDPYSLLPQPVREIPSELHERYTRHYSAILQEKFNYKRTGHNAKAFDALAAYIAHWRAAGEDKCDHPRRGLFLFGPPGTGKTTAMKLLSGLCQIEFLSTDALSKAFSLNSGAGFWSLTEEFQNTPLILDDLGCEEYTRSYGNILPIADFIRERERIWQQKNICTCFTSNAENRTDLIKRYGANVCSRLLGMCDFISMTGPDLRPLRRQISLSEETAKTL